MIYAYKDMEKKELKQNLIEFIKEIMPVAEENKVKYGNSSR